VFESASSRSHFITTDPMNLILLPLAPNTYVSVLWDSQMLSLPITSMKGVGNDPSRTFRKRGLGPQIPSPYARGREGPNQAPEPARWPLLARQPRDRGVVYGHGSGDSAAAFAGLEALEGLCLLVVSELGFPAEPHTF
jgi:hypothetical protein